MVFIHLDVEKMPKKENVLPDSGGRNLLPKSLETLAGRACQGIKFQLLLSSTLHFRQILKANVFRPLYLS